MDTSTKSKSRRQEIRKNRPDAGKMKWARLKEQGVPQAVGIALGFFVLAVGILMLRQDVVHYRPNQPITHDIVSRVAFTYPDKAMLATAQAEARKREPRVFVPDDQVWVDLEKELLSLPGRMGTAEPPADLAPLFNDDKAAVSMLRQYTAPPGSADYERQVAKFVSDLREHRPDGARHPLIVLPAAERKQDELARSQVRIGTDLVSVGSTYPTGDEALTNVIKEKAAVFHRALQARLTEFTANWLAKRPTHQLDEAATTLQGNAAAANVPRYKADRLIAKNEILVFKTKGFLDQNDWQLLRTENQAYLSSLTGASWKGKLGVVGVAAIITAVLAAYLTAFQPRAIRNHARSAAIAGLLLAMLILPALAAIGNYPIHLFGTAPSLLVAMILAIAYDRRFAIGVASLHGLLVTLAVDQSAPFFLVIWVGVLTAGFLLDDVRTRSKLVEVGGAAAIAMMIAAAAAGLLDLESGQFVMRNCLYTGAAGLAVGFVVLGILPFIERTFRMTTSMTLLELADVSQPLLRRLQQEAPGTYNHSLQVATLSEAAAEAIGGNSLLCRVASYYHDVGKINKPDYFVENQSDGPNRHLNLDPNLSLLIIIGHVKDGIEMAKEYNLPNSVVPFIQQHHGTTVVEYFYRRACTKQEQRDPSTSVSETQFRYPGPAAIEGSGHCDAFRRGRKRHPRAR